MPDIRTFSIKTLGCKFNQYESSEIAAPLINDGWIQLPFGEKVDAVIINTCTVTDRSDRKNRNYIRQGAEYSATGKVYVTGCMAGTEGDALSAMDEVGSVYSNEAKSLLAGEIKKFFPHTGQDDSGINKKDLSCKPVVRSRGYLKIQEGCGNSCAYCIVPGVRGAPGSRDMHEVTDHAQRLIDGGFHEIVLTGITIGAYSCGGRDLADLLCALSELRGDFRIRVTSIEPLHVSDRLLDAYGSGKICSHIHIPLQSGSSRILKRMNRGYGADDYRRIIGRVKSRYNEMAVGTDLIIGFPGEDEDDFRESLDMINFAEFAYVHAFRFSKRRGTPAADMDENSTAAEISERVLRAKVRADEFRQKYRAGFLNRDLASVIEFRKSGGLYRAVTDNYIKVDIANSAGFGDISGRMMNVKFTEIRGDRALGIVTG